MEDFKRDFAKRNLLELRDEKKVELLRDIPLETRLSGLSEKQIQEHMKGLKTPRKPPKRKPRRKK